MPELPEVEAARRFLERMVVGKRIVSCVAAEQGGGPREGEFDDKVIGEGLTRESFEAALRGRRVTGTGRKGKQLYVLLDAPSAEQPSAAVLVHLGMTGALLARGEPAPCYKNSKFDEDAWPPRFAKFELVADDGTRIAYVDSRRFGRVYLRGEDYATAAPLSELAPDPLLECPDLATFQAVFAARTAPIKAILLDQRALVAGVGNWVADEVLYQAGVHPASPANALRADLITALRDALIDVVTRASDVDAQSHRFPPTWLFHHRWANQTSGSRDSPLGRIHFDTVAGRTTAFLPTRQKLVKRITTSPSRGTTKATPKPSSPHFVHHSSPPLLGGELVSSPVNQANKSPQKKRRGDPQQDTPPPSRRRSPRFIASSSPS